MLGLYIKCRHEKGNTGMNIQSYDISDALNVPKWETIQNCFAELTNTAISLIDIAGNPVTACSNVSDFCQAVRENIQLDSLCRECDALAGLEAFRNRKPYIFICHCNLVAVAVPIVNGRRYIGAVMIGAFPPNESTFENGVQGISDEVGVTHIGEDRLAGLFQKLSARTYDDIKNISETIRAIIEGLMAQFGAISNSFWCSNLTISVLGTTGETSIGGMYNFTAFPILAITLCTGTLLGLVCNEGIHFIDPDTGKWQWPKSNVKTVISEDE